MVSIISKDLSLRRHLLEGLHAAELQREIRTAVILTAETPDIAQETTIGRLRSFDIIDTIQSITSVR